MTDLDKAKAQLIRCAEIFEALAQHHRQLADESVRTILAMTTKRDENGNITFQPDIKPNYESTNTMLDEARYCREGAQSIETFLSRSQ